MMISASKLVVALALLHQNGGAFADDNLPAANSVAVVGGGISGLVAAHNLKKLGYDVTVYEANNRVGGKLESVYYEENGVPSSSLLKMDPDMEAKAQDLCGDERPSELGGVISFSKNVRDLADEVGVPWGPVRITTQYVLSTPNGTQKMTRGGYLNYLAGEQDPTGAMGQSALKFFQMAEKFPEIKTPRLDGNSPELAKPATEFAEEHEFSFLLQVLQPETVGYGYAYLEDVPAGIALKPLYQVIEDYIRGESEENIIFGFPCGFQSLPEGLAKNMDVRLNAKVTAVTRTEDFAEVTAEGQPVERFKHLVVATTPDLTLQFLDADEEEKDLFTDRIDFVRYVTTIANIVSDEEDNSIHGENQFYVDQATEAGINHISLMTNTDNTGELAYQILDTEITLEEAFEVLNQDMASYWQGSATDIVEQREWANYYPTTSPEEFANGYYDRVEALQGIKNTYYVGSYLNFELVSIAEAGAKDIIERKFEELDPAMHSTGTSIYPESWRITLWVSVCSLAVASLF